MENVRYVYTVGMDDDEIATRLQRADAGVLSLAADGRAYAIPVHVHYDRAGGRLLFRLSDDGHSEKFEFVESTDEATFTSYGDEGEDSWSIVARGEIHRLPDDELPDDTTLNTVYRPLRVFDEDIADIELVPLELVLGELTGRKTAR
ncbi:pyridoxamine 5'-phosphate oxidase family protein [Haloferax namakaokahaiae]|uniref:Pyridoxamine 5'-phosphate oxidase family protein n=1 Tax=Haloferax namakaokahaiae TaxID=1748331 RepID=A0ABD5ZG46_9EURY